VQPFELPDFYVPWPARLNPNLDVARAHSKEWAREVGILDASIGDGSQIWDEQTFDRHDYALFCAYVHPEAPTEELNLMVDWNVWAFYVDDYFLKVYKRCNDRSGAKKYLDRVLLFMPVNLGPLPEPSNPMECALTDLWLRTAPTKSEAWRCRITESMRNLLEAFMWELDSMGQKRLANPIEYIEMRRQVGAALWSADLVEHAMLVEIPERIATTRPMRVLKDTFADGVHLRNDIFSYQREVLKEGELTNAVLVVERFLSVDTQRAANFVNDLLTSRLQQFEHTAVTELEPLFEEYQLDPAERLNVLTYVRGLQDWQSGAHEWHIQTSRYLNPNAAGRAPAMGIFLPGPTGLGTAAVRITPATLSLNRFKKYMHISPQRVGPTPLPKFYMPFTVSVNPHLESARQHSKAWARHMGMLDALPGPSGVFIWDERSFDVTDLALCSALVHPNATAAQLDLTTRWLIWGTYLDDYFLTLYGRKRDLPGAKIFHARLSEFMPVECLSTTSVPLTPAERGLADLWVHTAEALSTDARRLFREVIEGMNGSWLWELANHLQNRIPDPVDFIEMRRKTCGAGFMIVIPRLAQDDKIPPEVYRTRTMQELNNTFIDYSYMTNDVCSYQKEIEFEGEMHNVVLIMQNFMGCDRTQALEIVNNLMTARMKQFEHIATTELPVLFENFNLDTKAREQLLGYVQELRDFMCGQLRWHKATYRYDEFELRRLSALPKPFADNITGLGTAAARILAMVGDNRSNAVAGQPAVSCPAQAAQEMPSEMPKEVKPFAVPHPAPPFLKKEGGGVSELYSR
jgi:germacradienol/geosmin synthase